MTVAALALAVPGWAQTVVKIAFIPSESQAPLFLAEERGFYREQGIKPEFVRLPSGAAILAQVATGQVHAGGGALGAAAYNALHGKQPVAFVAPMHMAYNEDYFVVRKADHDQGRIKQVRDLKGQPCAVNARGVATEWILDDMLRKGGMTIDDIDLKVLPFPDMVVALETGAIRCGIVSEPFASLAEAKGVGLRPFPAPRGQRPVPITMLMWNTDWARGNPKLAQDFMVAFLKAMRVLSDQAVWQDPEIQRVVQKYTRVTPDVLKRS
ncbi:MAG: ABC transporter substrate-binding protein, partial [Deltaproteobacteria bacterium]|nr:ABC transporter substrate-binding protein [Deltaproteobacteria bacterium]